MADVAESAAFTDPKTAISHGKRHLLVQDYTMAVTALAQACQLLAEKHGDTADELAEPYLLYGRALLGLAREEDGVLGSGVPGAENDKEDEEETKEETHSNGDEEEEGEDDDNDQHSNTCTASEEKKEIVDKTEKGSTKSVSEKTQSVSTNQTEKVELDDPKEEEEKVEKKGIEIVESEIADHHKKTDKSTESSKEDENNVASSSQNTSHSNGPSSSTEQNGVAKKNGEDDGGEKMMSIGEDDEDEINNLQVAWEVLELAKLVLLKRGPSGSKLLADAYRLLGEVAMEGGNFRGALNDLHRCMELLQQIEPREPRAIAEIHYQLALAYSLGNEYDASIEELNKATELLETRIKELEAMSEPPKTEDSFYTVEGEIRELKELLPEIQEKISDMKDFKQMVRRFVIEDIKSKAAGGCSNGAGSSGNSESSSKPQKPVSNISHLVRKKRKTDDSETEVASPSKKTNVREGCLNDSI